jgi:hypothetical protein
MRGEYAREARAAMRGEYEREGCVRERRSEFAWEWWESERWECTHPSDSYSLSSLLPLTFSALPRDRSIDYSAAEVLIEDITAK